MVRRAAHPYRKGMLDRGQCGHLAGVTLGDGVVVGAGAVVTKSFDEGMHVAGVPAHPVASQAGAPASRRGWEGDARHGPYLGLFPS